MRGCHRRLLRFAYHAKNWSAWYFLPPPGVFTKMVVVIIAGLRVLTCPHPFLENILIRALIQAAAQCHNPDTGSASGTWICDKHQKELLDSLHKDRLPGSGKIVLWQKVYPSLHRFGWIQNLIQMLVKCAKPSTVQCLQPPGFVYRNHPMEKVPYQGPPDLHPKVWTQLP